MNKFRFIDRGCNECYFSTMDELLEKSDVLKSFRNRKGFIRFSISKNNEKYSNPFYFLMCESFTNDTTKINGKHRCVCGWIKTDENNDDDIYNIFPKYESDNV